MALSAIRYFQKKSNDNTSQQASSSDMSPTVGHVSWDFDGSKWTASGTPPTCPEPLLQPPADTSQATAVLYPGQIRGGNYKAHGGFLFNKVQGNKVSVKAPMDGDVFRGSRYIEQGEHQYMFDFINACGVMFRIDHLLDLTPKFAALADKLPPAQVDMSATTPISGASVKVGEEIATAVGFPRMNNVSFDLGVYNLKEQNMASKDASYATKHANEKETAFYGICWLDSFSSTISQQLKALPGGDQANGKTSDYCK